MDALTTFLDEHDVTVRVAFFAAPIVLYASYLTVSDRFEFICGSFGNYVAFAPGVATWAAYFLALPAYLKRRLRDLDDGRCARLQWPVMCVAWELQIVVAAISRRAHHKGLPSRDAWHYFHYFVSALLLILGPTQIWLLAPRESRWWLRRGPWVSVAGYALVFVLYQIGLVPKEGAIVAELAVMARSGAEPPRRRASSEARPASASVFFILGVPGRAAARRASGLDGAAGRRRLPRRKGAGWFGNVSSGQFNVTRSVAATRLRGISTSWAAASLRPVRLTAARAGRRSRTDWSS